MSKPDSGIAVIAGAGSLPHQIAVELSAKKIPFAVVQFDGVDLDWNSSETIIAAQYEKPKTLFKKLTALGIDRVVFAGSMQRPKLNPLKFDATFLKIAPSLLPAIKSGDDTTLRLIIKIFEDNGFEVVPAHEILGDVVAKSGVFTKAKPSKEDKSDIERGFQILNVMSDADVGQACVVAQGLCLGMESIQGSDAMLKWVADTGAPFRHVPKGSKGVFVKAPKRDQDQRIDLPAIGPDTVQRVSDAGLAGICVTAGSVMILEPEQMIALADKLGVFIWAKEA